MIIHDFIYEWDGKSKDGKKPVSWWPGAYHVRIVRLDAETSGVKYLIPTAVLLKNARQNPRMNCSLRNYIHTFAEKICEQYELDMAKTLWVEFDQEIRVTRLDDDSKLPSAIQFDVVWRDIRPNELEMIQPYTDGL